MCSNSKIPILKFFILGTLNPILQDTAGKPKKHVSTIVHILNDLLGGVDLKGNATFTTTGSDQASTSSSSAASTGTKRKSTEINPQPEKLPKPELDPEENFLLKSKVEKLINELKLKKRSVFKGTILPVRT